MVYIILGNGFEEIEAVSPYDILKRGGVSVMFAGVGGNEITGKSGIKVTAECTVEEIDMADAEMLVVPGGMGGVNSILGSAVTLDTLSAAYDAGIEIASICAGPTVLAKLGMLRGKCATCYPGMEDELFGAVPVQGTPVVRDGKITTSRGPGTAIDFGLAILSVLKGEEVSENVRAGMHYDKR